MKLRLEASKGFLVVLSWKDTASEKDIAKNENMNLNAFCSLNENSIAKKINILFNEDSHENMIESVKIKVENCINRHNVSWINQVQVKCENPNISFE